MELGPVQVVYEDNHLLALNKPPGLLTQDSGTGRTNLEDRARAYRAQSRDKPGAAFLHVVHRLDTPASGVVLCAATSKALSRLQAAQQSGTWQKQYLAVVAGHPPKEQGRLEHWLLHGDRRADVVRSSAPGAKRAALSYRVLERRRTTTLLEIQLETGRYHQIRAQWAAEGCPLMGDTHYGGPVLEDYPGIALHHRQLSLEHPVKKSALVLKAARPQHVVWGV